MRVGLYARVSTSEQSTEAQMVSLRSFSANRGFQVAGEYTDVVTGSERRRKLSAPGFERLMADARQRNIDAVIVWKLDRFARSVRLLVQAMADFQALGVEFVSVTQNIDSTTPSGKLFFHVFAAIAEFEREIIVERVRFGIANAKAKGVQFGRPRDFAMEARVCNLKDDGASVRKIAKLTGRSRAGVDLILKRAYQKGQA